VPRPDRCPACGRRHRRSNPANSRYWLLLHAIADKVKPGGISYSPETWHTYCKSRWIGCDDTLMPNGKTLSIPKSSANLDVTEFNDYMAKVEAWAMERGVWLDEIEGAA
jgi:hypothetical protein